MTKFKFFLLFSLAIAAFFLYATSKKSDWFSTHFIEYDKHLWPKVDTKELSAEQFQELKAVLDQPFHFLGSGNQTFAFVSNDGKYVLKFFKFQHLKENGFQSLFKNAESRIKRIHQVFSGHSLGYLKDQENSGILYAHLDSSSPLLLIATIYDKKKSKHSISLDDVVFVVQKKGESTNEVLSRLLDQGNLAEAKNHVRSLLRMYVDEYSKGLFDRDHNVMHNTGFCEGLPMHIDVGKLRNDEKMKDPAFFMADLKKVAWERIDLWMKKYYPRYRKEIANELNTFLEEIELLQKG